MPTVRNAGSENETLASAAAVHAKAVELGGHVLRMTTAAGSGHPSTALALCHIVVELMCRRMRYDPKDPWNLHNDRLVLSIGHGVPIIYAAYADLGGAVGDRPDDPGALASRSRLVQEAAHAPTTRLAQRFLTVDDLATLRERDSVLDGHPNPAEGFPFFDAATGSLGQGLSVGAGLGLAARLDGIDKRIFVLAGDGEAREGQVWEAMDFVVDHGLTNVCVVFSCNGHGQAAPVSPQQSAEAIAAKAQAFGWEPRVVDGHDPAALSVAFEGVGTGERPIAVVARTVKGWGVPLMQDSNFHGKPLPAEGLDAALAELEETGRQLGAVAGALGPAPCPEGTGRVPVGEAVSIAPVPDGLERVGLGEALTKKKLATRAAYGAALVALGDVAERVVVLDGDVSNSTYTNRFAKHHADRFFECKIAEQHMVTAAAGLAAAGKIPFANSFGKFIARATDQIDMAAISRANIKIVGSHSGVSLGADGPSQMSMADVAYFRSMTKVDNGHGQVVCHVFRPADAVAAYRLTELMANIDGMCYMRTHREAAPIIYPFDATFTVRGCKQLREGNRLTLVSSGYMLHTVLASADRLGEEGIACNVFDAYTFPLDPGVIFDAARDSGQTILTVEDNFTGGLHAELAEAAAREGRLRVFGMTLERLPKSARTAEEVFELTGVGMRQIIERAKALASG